MKKILLVALSLLLCGSIYAQTNISNQYSQFGTSASGLDANRYDRNGNPIDTTAVIDASTIPIGLFSWTVDDRLGTITQVPVDTLQEAPQDITLI